MADNTNDPEHEDAFLRGFRNVPAQHILEAMSEIELAEEQTKFSNEKPGLVIIKNEWRRREKLEQHKLNQDILSAQNDLNKTLVASQNSTVIIASFVGLIGAIVGAILTGALTLLLNKPQTPYSQQITIQAPATHPLYTPTVTQQTLAPLKEQERNLKIPAEAPTSK